MDFLPVQRILLTETVKTRRVKVHEITEAREQLLVSLKDEDWKTKQALTRVNRPVVASRVGALEEVPVDLEELLVAEDAPFAVRAS